VADEDCRCELEIVQQSSDIATVMLDRAFVRATGGGTVATKVAGHDFIGL
jgi:hypothetical protein